MRRFTGLANYYRRFVEGFAELVAPLTALGSRTAQASFDALKRALSTSLVLRTFDTHRRAVLTIINKHIRFNERIHLFVFRSLHIPK